MRPIMADYDSLSRTSSGYDSFELVIVLGIMACVLAIVVFVFLVVYVSVDVTVCFLVLVL